jgi:hypothetical protein
MKFASLMMTNKIITSKNDTYQKEFQTNISESLTHIHVNLFIFYFSTWYNKL